MANSRSRKALINTICELLLEVVTAICSFILPRLILSHLGSAYNGITSSISQFIGCIALLKSGIGSVTRAALYKPLSNNDSYGISEVTNATSAFLRRIAVVFGVCIVAFASLYPFLVSSEFDWLFSFTLVLILSISTVAQYFFGLTYQMVLQADQRNHIISIVTIISTIANTALSAIMIILGFGIHAVKLGSAFVFILPPLFYNVYVKKKYHIDRSVSPNSALISQRWDAFGHQVANFINQNTDIIVTTVFLGVKEVSVYSIYYMVGHAIQKLIRAFSTGTTAAFGNMIAKNEKDGLARRFNQYEFLMFFLSTVTLSITSILITPFVKLYTKGITDVNYIRPLFGYLVCGSIFFTCIKLPYEQMVYAAGSFKETRNGAFVEAAINIIISIILSNVIGLNGIIVGTIVALSYRTIRYNSYVCKRIVIRSPLIFLKKILYSVCCIAICFVVKLFLPLEAINTFLDWIKWAVVVSTLCMLICTILGFLFDRNDFVEIIELGKSTFLKSK